MGIQCAYEGQILCGDKMHVQTTSSSSSSSSFPHEHVCVVCGGGGGGMATHTHTLTHNTHRCMGNVHCSMWLPLAAESIITIRISAIVEFSSVRVVVHTFYYCQWVGGWVGVSGLHCVTKVDSVMHTFNTCRFSSQMLLLTIPLILQHKQAKQHEYYQRKHSVFFFFNLLVGVSAICCSH